MCANMSVLSYLGLIFSVIAVTLFAIIYSYNKMKGSNPNIVEELRQRSVDTYLAANTTEAKTNTQKFGETATVIDRLSVETRVLFWLIIAMNAAVNNYFHPRLSKCVIAVSSFYRDCSAWRAQMAALSTRTLAPFGPSAQSSSASRFPTCAVAVLQSSL